MKKRSLNKIKQMVSIGMSCIMAGSTCNLPMMLHAEEVQTENMHPTYMVTSFDELNEEIAYQALSIGAEESEINFPDTLNFHVEVSYFLFLLLIIVQMLKLLEEHHLEY